jgi:VRR-NUC domain
MKPPVPTERQVQRAILEMMGVAFRDVLVHHSPNGGHLAGDEGARFRQVGALKGDGMKPGWPDLTCVWNHGTAYIEVKRPGCAGRLSPDQKRIHAELAERGYPPAVVTSPAEAYAFLRERGAPTSVREWKEAA